MNRADQRQLDAALTALAFGRAALHADQAAFRSLHDQLSEDPEFATLTVALLAGLAASLAVASGDTADAILCRLTAVTLAEDRR